MKTSLNKGNYACTLPIKDIIIPDFVRQEILEQGLQLKQEFHITLIGFGIGKVIGQQAPKVIKNIQDFVTAQDFNPIFLNSYSLLEEHCEAKNGIPEHTRRTIIQDIELPGLKKLYDYINTLLNSKLELPYTHITLASRSDYSPYMQRGIGLCSKEDYKKHLIKLSKTIN